MPVLFSSMKNTLIKASAGTGKTFALATRMIRLMLLGTDPRHIVALTFSRAAAGEIFSRVAERLAAAATDAPGAAAETAHVLNGLPPPLADALQAAHPGGLSAAVFAGLLRNLIATQHVSMIGTIDSFMTRMVQAFPLELGLQGTLAIMDDYHASREKHAAAAALLNATSNTEASDFFHHNRHNSFHNRHKEPHAGNHCVCCATHCVHCGKNSFTSFCEAFQLATAGREGKSFCAKLDDFIDAWHTAYLNHPDAAAWGDPETIFGSAGFLPRNEKPNALECHRVPSNAVEDGSPASLASRLRDTLRADWEAAGRAATWDEFCDFVHAFNGTFSDKAAVRNVLAACTPVGDITISYNRRKVTFTAEKAALIREAVGTLLGIALKMRCAHTQGIHRLMALIESVYAANTRRHGKLVFDDIPRLIARLDDATRQNIEYRFDTRFRHWALDEFQDTSHAQWNAIRNLVEEVIQSTDERSMFIVGDMKQAIYGWRGGDVAIFEREAASGLYEQLALNDSYRYAPEIADCVNRIFDGGRIAAFLAARAEAAGAKWQRLWAPHRSAAKRNGHVSVRRVPAPDADAGERDIAPYLNAAREELARIRPWERGISAAVLVRTNTQGAQFAEALRAAHIPAVWEGESAISDTPVVTALLNLLRFAEHPGDTLAWQHIRATPLAARVFPDIFARPPSTNFFTQSHRATEGHREPLKENIPVLCASVSLCEKSGHCEAQHALSTRVLADVSRHGLPRALRGYTEAMGPTDPFTQSRLDMLLRAAVQFTSEADAEATLTDFADYVARFTTRDVADTSTVKIITVHRSKGLGFDHVILPLIEPKGITSLRADDILGAPDGTWLLTRPPRPVIEADPVLAAAAETALTNGVFEALCVHYVAMTRAKRAMTILLRPPPKTESDTPYFSNHIEAALGGPLPWQLGDGHWFEAFAGSPAGRPPDPNFRTLELPNFRTSPPRRKIASAAGHAMPASELFAARDTAATRRGTRIHDLLRQIEWLDNSGGALAALAAEGLDLTPPSAFRDALRRPPRGGVVELWRERAFELLDGDEWVSGTFDRVVFIEEGGHRRIELYDFKSNRPRGGEGEAAFAERMRRTYAGQMDTYRRALARLTGAPPSDIRATLLLTATRSAVSA